MKNNYIEHLTKSIIENDIKALYIWKIKSSILCTLFLNLGILVLWFSCDFGKENNHNHITILILVISILTSICVTVYLIHLIKRYGLRSTLGLIWGRKITVSPKRYRKILKKTMPKTQ